MNRENTGVFKRGKIWWYTTGRKSRHSSRSTNMEDAIALRAAAIASNRTRLVHDEWGRRVREGTASSYAWLRRIYTGMQTRSRRSNRLNCMTFEEFAHLVLMSNGKCAISGLPFAAEGRGPFTMSIDRIDSKQGYCPGNVRCVLLAINLGMSHWGEESFRQIARAVVGQELISNAYVGRTLVPRGTSEETP